MKILTLMLALVLGLGANFKKTANDRKEISFQHELNQFRSHPNMLPVIEVIGHRS